MKNDQRNYVIVGTFVIAMAVALILWIALMSGRGGSTESYSLVFRNLTQLKTGAQVLYEGYPIGFVEKIRPEKRDGLMMFFVTASIDEGWPIPVDSEATIASGIFEAPVIEISGGSASELIAAGSEIPAREATDIFSVANEASDKLTGILDDVGKAAPALLENVTVVSDDLRTAMTQINSLIDPENVGRVDSILTNIEGAAVDMNRLIDDVRKAGSNVNSLVSHLDALLDEESGDLSQSIDDLRHVAASLSADIDSITANLEAATRNANEFSKQIRENPGVLLRGREQGE